MIQGIKESRASLEDITVYSLEISCVPRVGHVGVLPCVGHELRDLCIRVSAEDAVKISEIF